MGQRAQHGAHLEEVVVVELGGHVECSNGIEHGVTGEDFKDENAESPNVDALVKGKAYNQLGSSEISRRYGLGRRRNSLEG